MIAERVDRPHRLNDEDAHDIDRILVAIDTDQLATSIDRLLESPVSQEATEQALAYVRDLYATGPDASGCTIAGRAEEDIGEPEAVALATSLLSADLLASIDA